MQFIKNGPDIPERLLQAHEEGKVVFFTGSGISIPAKLPNFEGLVNRLYLPLISAIKKSLLSTAQQYRVLGKHSNQYATLLTFAALEKGDIFTQDELAVATSSLPKEGLESVAHALVQALEGAGEQREEYWQNRILPYFHFIWPKSRDVISSKISESFALLCIAAKKAFPTAIEELKHWLQPLPEPMYVIHRLRQSQLNKLFPDVSLSFLFTVIKEDTNHWISSDLKPCLDEILTSKPELKLDDRFKKLHTILRRSE